MRLGLPVGKSIGIQWLLVAVFILLSAGIIIFARIYYTENKNNLKERVFQELESRAKTNAARILDWRKDKISDIEIFFCNPIIRRKFVEFLSSEYPDSVKVLGKELHEAMLSFTKEDDCWDVVIVDAQGSPRLSTSKHVIGNYARKNLDQILESRKISISDIHSVPEVEKIHFDIYSFSDK